MKIGKTTPYTLNLEKNDDQNVDKVWLKSSLKNRCDK